MKEFSVVAKKEDGNIVIEIDASVGDLAYTIGRLLAYMSENTKVPERDIADMILNTNEKCSNE